MSGFMYILTIIAMSLQYPNGVCMPPPHIVYFNHFNSFFFRDTKLTFCSFSAKKNLILLSNQDHGRYQALVAYNTPLVLGNASLSGLRFTAILIDLAKALKMASILWCSLSPLQLIFTLALAASLKDLKK